MTGDDDGGVIARSVTNPNEFAAIFDRHFVTIHRYLARRAGSDAADDLASEVFTVAFSKRASYDVTRPLALPWLYGIASNLLKADGRARRKHDHGELAVDLPSPEEPAEDRVVASLDAYRDAHALKPLLAKLSDGDLTTLLLYAWEDLSYEEIADALGVPVGTVRSRLNRVRRKLREPVEDPPTSKGYNYPTERKEEEQ